MQLLAEIVSFQTSILLDWNSRQGALNKKRNLHNEPIARGMK